MLQITPQYAGIYGRTFVKKLTNSQLNAVYGVRVLCETRLRVILIGHSQKNLSTLGNNSMFLKLTRYRPMVLQLFMRRAMYPIFGT